jgi:preprotein translocase subunit SecA
MLNILQKILGTKSDRDLKELQPDLDKILAVEPDIQQLTDNQLRQKTAEFRQRLADATKEVNDSIAGMKEQIEAEADFDKREDMWIEIDKLEQEAYELSEAVLEEIRPEAFSLIRETARRFTEKTEIEVTATDRDRELAEKFSHVTIKGDTAIYKNYWMAAGTEITWNMVHYDVQLIGGTVLHQGKIAEMATGEGKTLVATLPVYLNALPGKGVHVVTVNDYLARRDSEWMGPIFHFHGLTIDCIDKHQPNSEDRRQAYLADITYGTNNEFGFDYLRDNMARSPEDLVQRGHNYAIVDEVDSVLVDDARTPLIISGPTPKGDRHEFNELKPYVERITRAQREVVQEELSKARKLINEGNTKDGGVHLLRAHRGLPKMKALIKYLSEEGHRVILQKTENLYLQEQGKNMHIIDDELYFTIDEKHNQIDLTGKGVDLLSTDTDPDFFILTDIATLVADLEKAELPAKEKAEKKDEMMRDFAVKSERIHTMNQLLKAYALFEKDVEYVVMDNKVKIVDEQTGRIMEGRRYSDGLHQAIEAKENVKIEAATQTYATITLQNYFRMYNKLAGMTGTAETEAGEFWEIYKLDVVVIPTNRPIARDDRQDLVYKTTREKYNAVIDEIQKLRDAGRPILVGTTSVEVSELLSRALKMRKVPHQVLNAKLHQKEADIVAEAGRPGTVTIATNMAGRGTDIKLAPESKEAGGLAIIGTERHDSRRVDRQLRGRAGRQGDPGSSQFFVSLEDNLMRLFGSERIAGLMDRMGLKEGEVIQHRMVSKSIERAQKKVEENNFGIRKRLLEYDDVMNNQREVIYKRRKHALFGERLQTDIANMVYDSMVSLIDIYQPVKDYEGFKLELFRIFSMETEISAEDFEKYPGQDLVQKLYQEALEHYKRKSLRIAESAYPVIKQVYEQQQNTYQNIVVPFTDGVKALQVVTNLQKAYDSQGKLLVEDFEKNITLAIIDDVWKEHLRDLDDLRQSVQGAVYEQKDPLLIYKFESFELFKGMVDRSNKDIISFLFKGALPAPDPSQMRRAPVRRRNDISKLQTSRPGETNAEQVGSNGEPNPTQPVKVKQVVNTGKSYGRNEVVTLRNMATGEQKTMKYKKAAPMVDSGQWVVED